MRKSTERLLKEGEARGEARDAQKRLLHLLRQRFGELPDPVVQRVQDATPPDLDRWFDRILGAKTLDEVFAAQ